VMNVETRPDLGSADGWHAGRAEKIGAVASFVLLGGAYFFPETGKIFPKASFALALIDLAYIGIKEVYRGAVSDIDRMIRDDQELQSQEG